MVDHKNLLTMYRKIRFQNEIKLSRKSVNVQRRSQNKIPSLFIEFKAKQIPRIKTA